VTKVIGLTGTFLAGTGTAGKMLSELLDAPILNFGDAIREMLRRQGKTITRDVLHETGNAIRHKDPAGISKLLLSQIAERPEPFFVVEKLRSLGDYRGMADALGKDFILIALDAPPRLRYSRLLLRRREGEEKLSFEQFLESEKRELDEGPFEWQMHISALMARAEAILVNDGSEQELRSKLEAFIVKTGLR